MLGIPLPGARLARIRTLKIGDVANAYDSHVEHAPISHYNGKPRVYVEHRADINADEIKSTQVAREQIKKIEAQFPQLTFHEIDAPADYTSRCSLNGVWQSLFEGIFLTAIVMMLFLHAWRNAVVVMVAIPTSILATFVVMNVFGFHLDSMSLMGLSLIIGILVDDSIVVLGKHHPASRPGARADRLRRSTAAAKSAARPSPSRWSTSSSSCRSRFCPASSART